MKVRDPISASSNVDDRSERVKRSGDEFRLADLHEMVGSSSLVGCGGPGSQ
jgi:hypothetical protein